MKIRAYNKQQYVEYNCFNNFFCLEVKPYYDRQRKYLREKDWIYPLPTFFDSQPTQKNGGNSKPQCFFQYSGRVWLVAKDSRLMPFWIAKQSFENEEDPFMIIEKQTATGRTKLKLRESLIPNLIQEFDEQKSRWKKLGWDISGIKTPTWEKQGCIVYEI